MHRIDTSTAQKDKFGAGKNGFTEGNPQTGTPATALNSAFFDTIQEEIAGVVESTGVALNESNNSQLNTAIRKIITDAITGEEGELGTAAYHNVQTSPMDETVGAVQINGGWGIGGAAPRTPASTGETFDDIPFGLAGGLFSHQSSGGPYAYTVTLQSDGGAYPHDVHIAIPSGAGACAILLDGRDGSGNPTRQIDYLYSENNKPPYPVESVNGQDGVIVLSAADVHALPDTYNPDLSAYITTSAANAKFVQGLRLGTAVTMTYGIDRMYTAPSGCMMTGILASGSDDSGSFQYKPVQTNINGVWATIAG